MTDIRPKPFAFILMPIARAFDDVYHLGTKPACESAGAYAERVDELIFEGSILQRICNQIAKADVIIADMSGRNANVFYEVGYAHALGKRVVLLTQDVNDIPFDLKHHSHIIYGGRVVDLKQELDRRLRYILEHPDAPVEPVATGIVLLVNDVNISEPALISMALPASRKQLSVTITIHNSADVSIQTRKFELGQI